MPFCHYLDHCCYYNFSLINNSLALKIYIRYYPEKIQEVGYCQLDENDLSSILVKSMNFNVMPLCQYSYHSFVYNFSLIQISLTHIKYILIGPGFLQKKNQKVSILSVRCILF